MSGRSGNEKSGLIFETEWQNLTNQKQCRNRLPHVALQQSVIILPSPINATLWHSFELIATNVRGEYLWPIRGIRGGSFMQNSASRDVVKSENDIQVAKQNLFDRRKMPPEQTLHAGWPIISRLLYSHTRSDTRNMWR